MSVSRRTIGSAVPIVLPLAVCVIEKPMTDFRFRNVEDVLRLASGFRQHSNHVFDRIKRAGTETLVAFLAVEQAREIAPEHGERAGFDDDDVAAITDVRIEFASGQACVLLRGSDHALRKRRAAFGHAFADDHIGTELAQELEGRETTAGHAVVRKHFGEDDDFCFAALAGGRLNLLRLLNERVFGKRGQRAAAIDTSLTFPS